MVRVRQMEGDFLKYPFSGTYNLQEIYISCVDKHFKNMKKEIIPNIPFQHLFWRDHAKLVKG